MEPIGDYVASHSLEESPHDLSSDGLGHGITLAQVWELDFWCSYSILEDVGIHFPSDPLEVHDTTQVWEPNDLMYWPCDHLAVGLGASVSILKMLKNLHK